jgi:hypothetical protein
VKQGDGQGLVCAVRSIGPLSASRDRALRSQMCTVAMRGATGVKLRGFTEVRYFGCDTSTRR